MTQCCLTRFTNTAITTTTANMCSSCEDMRMALVEEIKDNFLACGIDECRCETATTGPSTTLFRCSKCHKMSWHLYKSNAWTLLEVPWSAFPPLRDAKLLHKTMQIS